MQSDEAVGEFFDRLDALAYACGGTDAEIWTVSYRGLIPVVRDKLPIPKRSWTVQDLVSKATAAQQYIRQSAATARHRAKANENVTPMVTPDQVFDMPAEQLLAFIKERTAREVQPKAASEPKKKVFKGKPHFNKGGSTDLKSEEPRKSKYEGAKSGAKVGCIICGQPGHTSEGCFAPARLEKNNKKAASKGMSLITLSEYSSVLMKLRVSIKAIPNRLVTLDSGANLNYMHVIEAQQLGLKIEPSNLGSVTGGNEALLEVVGMVIACVAVTSKCSATLFFNITRKLPYRVIIGIEGMTILNVMLQPSTMSVIHNNVRIPCLKSTNDREDSILVYDPVQVLSHDDEMELDLVPTMEEVSSWANPKSEIKPWTMPEI
jgi:hypothetical protein